MGTSSRYHAAAGTSGRPDNAPPLERKSPTRRLDLDDDELDLSDDAIKPDVSRDTSQDVDENWEPADDSDFELISGDEEVGLDTSTGTDDGADTDAESLNNGREDERWTTDSEAADDLPGTDIELLESDESGWIGDEDSDEDADDWNELDDDTVVAPADDGGLEGLDDDTELDDFDMSNLPAIDAEAEEDSEPLAADGLDELSEIQLRGDEPLVEIRSGVSWKQLPASSVRVTELARLQEPHEPVQLLAAHADRLLVCSEPLALFGPADEVSMLPVLAAVLELPSLTGAALFEHVRGAWLAFAGPRGLLVSRDGGATFFQDPQACEQVAFTRRAQAPRLWLLRDGKLELSDDAGITFTAASLSGGRVLRFATDGERRIVALMAAEHGGLLRVARSSDGGRRFAITESTTQVPAPLLGLQICGDAILVCTDNAALCAIAPRVSSFAEAIPSAGPPATLVDEDDELMIYASVVSGERALIVRRGLRAESAPSVLCSWELAAAGRPQLMAAHYVDGLVTLQVATERALLRVEASLDGEPLA